MLRLPAPFLVLWGKGPNEGDWLPNRPGPSERVRTAKYLFSFDELMDKDRIGKAHQDFSVWIDHPYIAYRFERLRPRDATGILSRDLPRGGDARGGRIDLRHVRSIQREGPELSVVVDVAPNPLTVRFGFKDDANAQQFESELTSQVETAG